MASEKQTTDFELKDMVSELLKMQTEMMKNQYEMKVKLDTLSSEVRELGNRVARVEKSREALLSGHPADSPSNATSDHIEQVHQSIAANVCFNSPLNMVFYGIEGKQGMTPDALFRDFMIQKLHVDREKAFDTPIHVQYLPKMSQSDVHFPVCVSFRSNKDKEYMHGKAKSHKNELDRFGIWVRGTQFKDCYWSVK